MTPAAPDGGAWGIPDPPREIGRLAGLLRAFGPGAIIASVSIAAGETIFAARGGAIFGYRLLWLIALAGILKTFMIYAAARYAVVSGDLPIRAWCALPGPRGWPAAFLLATCVLLGPFALAPLASMLAAIILWMTKGAGAAEAHPGAMPWISLGILIAFAGLAWRSSYGLLETAEKICVAILMGVVAFALVAASPDWLAVLRHTLLPEIPAYPDWLTPELYPDVRARRPLLEIVTYFGVVGGTLPDYVAYLAFLREKGWGRLGGAPGRPADAAHPDDVRRARAWLRLPLFDLLVSLACVTLFTMAFMVLGAEILHPAREVPDKLILFEKQAAFFRHVHPGLVPVYEIGILAAFAGTLYGAFEVQIRTVVESLAALAPHRAWPLGRVRPWFFGWCVTASAILLFLGGLDPIGIYTLWSLVAGTFALGLWCFAMLWADRRFLPEALRMPAAARAGTAAAGIVMTALGLASIARYFGIFGA